MFIKDGIYRSIKPQVALPIAEGTVLTINGLAATADTAYGIVPAKITALSPTKQIYVAVSGTIDLKDPANKGVSFNEDMIKALGKDFNFVPAEEGSGSGLPEITEGDVGKVLKATENGAEWAEAGSGVGVYDNSFPFSIANTLEGNFLGDIVWDKETYAGKLLYVTDTVTTDDEQELEHLHELLELARKGPFIVRSYDAMPSYLQKNYSYDDSNWYMTISFDYTFMYYQDMIRVSHYFNIAVNNGEAEITTVVSAQIAEEYTPANNG